MLNKIGLTEHVAYIEDASGNQAILNIENFKKTLEPFYPIDKNAIAEIPMIPRLVYQEQYNDRHNQLYLFVIPEFLGIYVSNISKFSNKKCIYPNLVQGFTVSQNKINNVWLFIIPDIENISMESPLLRWCGNNVYNDGKLCQGSLKAFSDAVIKKAEDLIPLLELFYATESNSDLPGPGPGVETMFLNPEAMRSGFQYHILPAYNQNLGQVISSLKRGR